MTAKNNLSNDPARGMSFRSRLARKIRHQIDWLNKTYIKRDPFQLEVNRWFRDRGDETLRLDYPLQEDSVVFDLGGYKGDFAAAIHERYKCKVFLFEPVLAFYQVCANRFKGNPKIACFHFGLSSAEGEFYISDEDNASSLVNGKAVESGEKVKVRKMTDFMKAEGIGKIDLLKINIEGGEYDVLPCLIDAGKMGDIRFLQVQFHDFIPGAVENREKIRDALKRTHEESWNYEFVWESWKKRAN